MIHNNYKKIKGYLMMTEAEKILKSLALAGVEWELCDKSEIASVTEQSETIFSIPKSRAPIQKTDICEIACKRASGDVMDGIKCFCEHPLFAGAKNTVLPSLCDGPAPLVVITDIPSSSDDASGQILSGADGELFDKMIQAIGFKRSEIAIVPLVFWRPAGGRTPTQDEIAFCKPFVERILQNLSPRKILTLGTVAAKEIAGAALPKDLGREFGNVVPIFKPDFILENQAVKKDVWEALKKLTPHAD